MHPGRHKGKAADGFYFSVHVPGPRRIKSRADVIRARVQRGPRKPAPPSRAFSARESRPGWKPVTPARAGLRAPGAEGVARGVAGAGGVASPSNCCKASVLVPWCPRAPGECKHP